MTRSRSYPYPQPEWFFHTKSEPSVLTCHHWSDRYREPRKSDFQERLKDAYAPLPGPELEAGGGNTGPSGLVPTWGFFVVPFRGRSSHF